MKITQDQLIEHLTTETSGTSFITIDIATTPQMRKTDNPFFGKIKKHQTLNGVIGYSYQNAVNRIAEKEDKAPRDIQPRKWGETSSDNIFVSHNNKIYLKIKVESSANIKYIQTDTNQEIPKEQLEKFLPSSGSKSITQIDLTREVIERTIALENIKSIRFNKQEYEVI